MKKYDQYKNSGVEWLGEIPEHWEILPGLSFIYENKDRNKGMVRNTVLSLSYGNIRVKGENELTGLVPESFETYQFVNKGDLIFRPTDLQNDTVSLRSSISEYDGIITNAYLNLRFKSKADSKFYHYFFRSIDNNKIIYGLGSGLRQNISYLDFRRFPFPFPPKEEQTAIANFLDDKTTKIDQAIAIKQKQIELLKERRQILIHKAVTRGLNDKVKLKDSGVEWIGEIPEHWEVKPLKYIGNSIIGLTYSPNDLCDQNEGILVFRSSNLFEGKIKYGEKENVYVKSRISDKLMVKENDILICSRNGSRDLIGKCALISKEDIGNSFGAFTTVFRSEINPYIFCILNSSIFKALSGMFLTSTINQLTIGNLNSILVPIPPSKEMDEIRNFVENINIKIDTAISLKEQEIEKLKEYKMSLIDGVVTGKVKVC